MKHINTKYKNKINLDANQGVEPYLTECEETNGSIKEGGFLRSIIYNQIWKVIPESTPRMIKVCPRCNNDRFYSSDMFRMNANQKKLDGWLIYKCESCDYTRNLSIARRISNSKINVDLRDKLNDNDEDLAWTYAFEAHQIDKNTLLDWNIKIRTEPIENKIEENVVGIQDKFNILAYSKYNLKIAIDKIIRDKTKISRSKLEKLYTEKNFQLFSVNGSSIGLYSNANKGFIIISDNNVCDW